MGIFKKYSPMVAQEALYWCLWDNTGNCTASGSMPSQDYYINTPTYYDVLGNTFTNVNLRTAALVHSPFSNYMSGIFYASSSTLENYNVNNYAVEAVGSTTSKGIVSFDNNKAERMYIVTISNTSGASITVNSLKYQKRFNSSNDFMMWAYFFDEPIVIPNNKSANIKFKITKNFDLS